MSTESGEQSLLESEAGSPELTELGKRIEVLRIQRGLSKQHLARFARTSRQQIWRVLTGKSELTTALRERLAQVLEVDPSALTVSETSRVAGSWIAGGLAEGATTKTSTLGRSASSGAPEPLTFEQFLAGSAVLERALRQLPSGEPGRRLKRVLLDAVEDLAMERGAPLRRSFFDLRRRVLTGEL